MEHDSGVSGRESMPPVADWQKIIDKYYHAGTPLRDILLKHSRCVADLACSLAASRGLAIDDGVIESAAMLHDIGVYLTHAPSIACEGDEPYIRHGILGAALLRGEGVDEAYARVAERHTGAGLLAREIAEQGLPLPNADLVPETLLEKLICYADKFFSKSGDMKMKPFDKVRASMERFGASSLERFDELAGMFGRPEMK